MAAQNVIQPGQSHLTLVAGTTYTTPYRKLWFDGSGTINLFDPAAHSETYTIPTGGIQIDGVNVIKYTVGTYSGAVIGWL